MPHPAAANHGLDVAIVGAGISGLLAATQLTAAGLRVRVFEKGRVPGGRMATRRFGDAVFDHGAQYFTARDPVFRGWVEGWMKRGLVHLWSDGFATASGALNQNGEPRFVSAEGMTSVPRHLAEGLRVQCGATIESCAWEDGRWRVRTKGAPEAVARVLVLTAPVPQSLELLDAGGVSLSATTLAALGRIQYTPCLAALVRLMGPSRIPSPGGLWLGGEPLGWVADNTQKGLSPAMLGASLTLHAGPAYSREHWGTDPHETAADLAHSIQDWMGSEITATQVHRWKFSTPVVVHPERTLSTTAPGPLVFAGDAFGGPRVEGAALSGLAAGEAARILAG